MATTETTKLQAALERALVALEAGDVHAAERAVRAALQETGVEQMLTPAQAARWLGIQLPEIVSLWYKQGFLEGKREDEHFRIPLSELERVDDSPEVRGIRAADAAHDASREFGVEEGLTQEEMDMLSATRPGILPWQREPEAAAS